MDGSGYAPAVGRECSKCHEHKLASQFIADPRYKTGLGSWCATCRGATKRAWEAKERKRTAAARGTLTFDEIRMRTGLMLESKRCRGCLTWKPFVLFADAGDGRTKSRCKSCHRSRRAAQKRSSCAGITEATPAIERLRARLGHQRGSVSHMRAGGRTLYQDLVELLAELDGRSG